MKLTHHFLLSMPQMLEGYFAKTLIYICDHDERGALGLIVNRQLDMDINDILQEMKIPTSQTINRSIFDGGPVDPTHGLVLHQGNKNMEWPGSHLFSHDIYISSSREILQAIANDSGPQRSMLILGHSGWGPGQLEEELAQNTWLSVPADIDILFSTPVEAKLQKAADSLGIDFVNLSSHAGHA